MRSIKRNSLNTVSNICVITFMMMVTKAVNAQSNNLILNPSFENGFTNWEEVEPTSISDHNRTGIQSAKITGSDAKISQVVQVKPNTDYVLSGYIKNFGLIGILTDKNKRHRKKIHGAEDWTKAEVEFNSGSSRSVTVYAEYYREQGRYDDLVLIEKSAVITSTSALLTQCPGNGNIPVQSAYDDGTNDGNQPSNIIDGNLANRWSSKGIGKTVTFDLGQIVEVKQFDVIWYKGAERINLFSVQTSVDGSNWQTVLADASSTSVAGFESHDIENFLNSNARFVKVIGGGNSSNEWNSMVEAKIKGCVN